MRSIWVIYISETNIIKYTIVLEHRLYILLKNNTKTPTQLTTVPVITKTVYTFEAASILFLRSSVAVVADSDTFPVTSVIDDVLSEGPGNANKTFRVEIICVCKIGINS